MLNSDFIQFLYDISQNNNRDWFEKNKSRFENTVKKPWENVVDEIIKLVQKFEPDFRGTAKDSVYRIYRDIRFSTDKTPYKDHVAASISKFGRKDMMFPAYYFQLGFGSLAVGGGAYFLEKDALHKVRTAITQDPETFRALISEPSFVKNFGEIKGEKNKVLPPEFKELVKREPLVANKQFYFMAELDPQNALRADFAKFVADMFETGKPVNEFLRSAIR